MDFYSKADLARKFGVSKERLTYMFSHETLAQPTHIVGWDTRPRYTREQFNRLVRLWQSIKESQKQLTTLE